MKTLKEEWLIWKDPADTIELQECLDEFRRWYNELRDHSALNYQVPEVKFIMHKIEKDLRTETYHILVNGTLV